MADGMLGEQVLPEEVQSRRRKIRRRLTKLREPLRSRRQELVPGPDVIGTAERNLMNLRSKISGGDGILPSRGSGNNSSSGSSGGEEMSTQTNRNSVNT